MTEEADSLELSALERVGRTVCDRWTLERLLGYGGVAAVYAARHRNGRRVAIKILHPELAVDTRMRKRFLREGYVANKVAHEGAVAVLDDAVDVDGTVILVMELLEGETLAERCARHAGRLENAEALVIAHGLLDILISAHREEILHRDVTPSNVFITTDGVVKLLDFGIARMRTPGDEAITGSIPGALGTPGFMPSEQARGLWAELDARTDLWAVGAVLYRILVGTPVHTGRTQSEVLLAAMTKPAKSLAEALPGAPEPMVELVDRALQLEKERRFPDATSFRAAVADAHLALTGKAIDRATLRPPPPPPAVKPSVDRSAPTQGAAFGTTVPMPLSREKNRLRPVWVTVGLGLVLGTIALVALNRKSDEPRSPTPAPAVRTNIAPEVTAPLEPPDVRPMITPSASISASATAPAAPAAPPFARGKAQPAKPARDGTKSEDDVLNQRK